VDGFSSILKRLESGGGATTNDLLPFVYAELRRLADEQLRNEKPGLTLQPTALIHEAYLRLAGDTAWKSRGHFFAAAAEAMRRVLVDRAREKGAIKRGGNLARVELPDVAADESDDELLALDESLSRLAAVDPVAEQLVKLRYFAGLSASEAAGHLGIAERSAGRLWAFARAWLRRDIEKNG
jgi:RNA polymerase sigma factor (TIGR02999 family)